jgi:multidrug resistance efflux pump
MSRVGFVLFLLSFLMSSVQAKDLSAQQAGFNNALKKMERAEALYKSDAQSVVDTEKAIEKKRQQLSEEQKKAELSQKNYLDAKEKLDQAQQILDQAWKD